MSHRFALAPMSPVIKGTTLVVLALPPIFGVWALVTRDPVPGSLFLFLIALYGVVWLGCRPSCFVIASRYLEIMFPIWRRRISIADIARIRLIDREAFSQEFGWAIRIGVGGLWGGFGWLWTTKQGLIEFYISRLDAFVLIERSHGKKLMITPENPDRFIEVTQNSLTSSNED